MSCEVLEIKVGDIIECVPIVRPDVVELGCNCPDVIEIVGMGPMGPRGPAGTLQNLVQAEVPIGLINSSNTVYTTLVDFSKIWVYLNGLRMNPGSDYDITDVDEITFTYAPTTGDTLIVDYIPA